MENNKENILFFIVDGKQGTAGSKTMAYNAKTGKSWLRPANPRQKPFMQLVSEMAAYHYRSRPYDGAIGYNFTFYLSRPKGHYGTGKNAGKLKPSARLLPTVKPDVLKMARAVEDALTGIVWRDDSQVVDATISKHYTISHSRTEIRVVFL